MNVCPELIITTDENLIGQGGFSKIYKIFTPEGEIFAVKSIDLDEISLKEAEDIKQEIRIQKKINHPNIAKVHKYIKKGRFLYII